MYITDKNIKGGYLTLLLEPTDFLNPFINFKKKLGGHRFDKVLIPEIHFENFNKSDMYNSILPYVTIGATDEFTKYIKY